MDRVEGVDTSGQERVREEIAVAEGDGSMISTRRVLVMALGVQGIVLALAWAGLHFGSIEVFWGIEGAEETERTLLYLLLGLLGAAATYWIGRAMTLSKTHLGATLRGHCQKLYEVFRHLNWLQIIALALAAGICEELLFRGFLQPWIASFSGPLVGLLVASVVFGLLHYASFAYFLMTTVMGLLLGATYWWSESLLAVIVWHGAYDLIALGVLAKFPEVLGLNVAVRNTGAPESVQ